MIAFRSTLAAMAAALLLVSPVLAQDATGIAVQDPFARVMAGVGGSGAVFFVLQNHGDADVTLTGATTDMADMAGLHTHVSSADGMMQMMPIEGGVDLPAGTEHAFVRGGDHIMLMGLHVALKPGDTITVTLTFDGADPVTFDAVVDNDRAPAG